MSVIEKTETVETPRLGEQFQPPMSDEFARRALRRAERLELLLPPLSRTQLAAVLVLCAVYLLTGFHRLHHTDLWAHLGFGRAMVESGRLLAEEPFGVPAPTQPFFNAPWLAQISGYLVYQAGGAGGLQLAHALLATLGIAAVMAAVRARRVSWAWAVAAGACGYLLSITVVGVIRPQLFGMVALPLVLLAAARISRRRDPLFWLPPLFLLWANLHGSFVMGLVVLGCLLPETVWTARRRCDSLSAALAAGSCRRAALLAALCMAATWIHPHGFGLWAGVLGFSQQQNLADIVEWRPLVLPSVGGLLMLACGLVTAALLRVSPRRFRLSELLLLLAFGLLALLSMRMLAWWALVWPWVIVPHAAAWARHRRRAAGRAAETDAEADKNPLRALIATAAVFLALVWAPASHALLSGRPLTPASAASRETPILLAEYLNQRQIEGTLFTSLEWSDYLLWHTEGRLQPLVYSHVHLMDPAAWESYRQISSGSAAWLRLMEQHELRYLALPQRSPVTRMLWNHPRTGFVYQDQQAVLLELLPAEQEQEVEETQVQEASAPDGLDSPNGAA